MLLYTEVDFTYFVGNQKNWFCSNACRYVLWCGRERKRARKLKKNCNKPNKVVTCSKLINYNSFLWRPNFCNFFYLADSFEKAKHTFAFLKQIIIIFTTFLTFGKSFQLFLSSRWTFDRYFQWFVNELHSCLVFDCAVECWFLLNKCVFVPQSKNIFSEKWFRCIYTFFYYINNSWIIPQYCHSKDVFTLEMLAQNFVFSALLANRSSEFIDTH